MVVLLLGLGEQLGRYNEDCVVTLCAGEVGGPSEHDVCGGWVVGFEFAIKL